MVITSPSPGAPPPASSSPPAPPPPRTRPCLAALDSISSRFLPDVYRACRPEVGREAGTGDQFRTVMRMLCASKYGAVLKVDLVAALGVNGEEAVMALLKANILGMRPRYSKWELQIPAEAWGGRTDEQLITASTAPMMYAMRAVEASSIRAAAQAAAKAVAWARS